MMQITRPLIYEWLKEEIASNNCVIETSQILVDALSANRDHYLSLTMHDPRPEGMMRKLHVYNEEMTNIRRASNRNEMLYAILSILEGQ